KDEKFWDVQSQHSSIRVTEGHNIYYKKKGYFWCLDKPNLISKARDMHEKKSPFILPISSEYNYKGVNLLDDELRILGWYLTDGWLEGKTKSDLAIAQTKPHGIAEIKRTLDSLGWNYTIRTRKPTEYNYPSTKESTIFRIPLGHRKKQKGFKHIRHLFTKD